MKLFFLFTVSALALFGCAAEPTPLPSPVPSATPIASLPPEPTVPPASATPQATATLSPAPTRTPTISPTHTLSPTPSPSVTALATVTATTTPPEPPAGLALVQALQNGGYTIVFRHAITDQSQDDVVPQELEDCTKQRNLNERGRLQAGEIGAAISTLEIPIGIVLSSPYCRTRETALLAFGRAETTSRLDNAFINVDRRAELETALVQLVGEPPSAGTNTVLVTHGYNMQLALGVSVVEGEAVVVQRDGAGGFRVIAELTSEEWQELALR